MSKKRIAINGFGRIGRLTARNILTKYPDIEIVAVNDLTDSNNLAYLFKYDTAYHQFDGKVTATSDGFIEIESKNGLQKIAVLSQKDPLQLPWKDLNIDLVIESTGFFTEKEKASLHLQAGAKKVLISAPSKGDVPTVVLGVNKPETEQNIISNASCTTNCIAPALKVLEDEFGIVQAFGITAHSYTASQVLQDGPSRKAFRDGRAAAQNLIPSSTGAAKAVFEVIPELKGKVSLSALRVPTITASMVYLTLELEKETTVETINKQFEIASQTYLKGILDYSEEELVSSDIIGNPYSCIFDSKLTELMGKTAKIVVWYDNEWGYSNRLAELADML